ncbi:hypothetical protein [Methylomonas rapida]|uniref:Uncharacterized protein n=1 Tax=Methylomonas rapida TaxID=2963939 RepID=A0ABY7GN85_9GAMM|nr:hypothetical protein [Methylomonas rapida]WAR45950.1 hypothetical protein NM686_005375 [Methylomonas rapida]
MQSQNDADKIKRVKNIAAVLYLLVMVFLVGGSYWHQHGPEMAEVAGQSAQPR